MQHGGRHIWNGRVIFPTIDFRIALLCSFLYMNAHRVGVNFIDKPHPSETSTTFLGGVRCPKDALGNLFKSSSGSHCALGYIHVLDNTKNA